MRQEYPHSLIPPIPAKSVTNRFKSEFLVTRAKWLQRFLECVFKHKELKNSGFLKIFLESTGSKEFQTTKEILSNSGRSLSISSISKNVESVMTTTPEIDPWYEAFNEYLAKFEKYLLKQEKFLKDLIQNSNDSAQLMYQLSEGINLYGRVESKEDDELTTECQRFAEQIVQIVFLRKDQMNAYHILLEQISFYIHLLPAAKELLNNRMLLLQTYFQTRQKTHQLLERLVAEDTQKRKQTELELRTWEEKTTDTATQFRSFSRKARAELYTHFYKKVEFLQKLRQFVSSQYTYENKVSQIYQNFLDDLNNNLLVTTPSVN